MNSFQSQDWSYSIYSSSVEELKEALPPNMSNPHGHIFKIRCFVDADHAGESLTRRSWTEFIFMLNNAPIYCHLKKHPSVETSTFRSEMIAMKQEADYIRGFRYKLRMFVIPVEEPSYMYGYNQLVIAGSTIPESTLNKKAQSISFHFIREGCAEDEWNTTYINTSENISDFMTKPLSGEKRWQLIRMLLQLF